MRGLALAGVGAGSKNDPVTALCLSRKLLPDLGVAGPRPFLLLVFLVSPLLSALPTAALLYPFLQYSLAPLVPVFLSPGAREVGYHG